MSGILFFISASCHPLTTSNTRLHLIYHGWHVPEYLRVYDVVILKVA